MLPPRSNDWKWAWFLKILHLRRLQPNYFYLLQKVRGFQFKQHEFIRVLQQVFPSSMGFEFPPQSPFKCKLSQMEDRKWVSSFAERTTFLSFRNSNIWILCKQLHLSILISYRGRVSYIPLLRESPMVDQGLIVNQRFQRHLQDLPDWLSLSD